MVAGVAILLGQWWLVSFCRQRPGLGGGPMNEVTHTDRSCDGASLPSWRLSLLGAWQLCVRDNMVDVGINGQRLLALLALRGACDRPFISGILWPDCSDQHAQANLRATLTRLHRRHVDHIIHLDYRLLSLQEEVRVDVQDLIATASAVLDGTRPPDRCALRQLCANDLLAGWYEDWVLCERERLRQLRLHALEALSGQLLAIGDPMAAVDAALEAVALEPLRESAHRAAIRAYLVEGNRGEALYQLGKLRHLLLGELGIQPSTLATDLFN
jgi:DNA-binding SARP family transcriptional activator